MNATTWMYRQQVFKPEEFLGTSMVKEGHEEEKPKAGREPR